VQQKWRKIFAFVLLFLFSLSPLGRDHFSLSHAANVPVSFSYFTQNMGKQPTNMGTTKKIIPGGQSIGIKLKSKGIMVVGYHLVHASTGNVSPAEQAGIQIGDTIVAINGKSASDVEMLGKFAAEAGKVHQPIQLTILRNKRTRQVKLTPLFDQKDQTYRVGMYVRDTAAGVGTLTFFDPDEQKYGALGHVISDVDTGQPIAVGKGKILRSHVTSIQKGENGDPGEKRAIFTDEDQEFGTIVRNTPFGIFGKMKELPNKGIYQTPIPIATQAEVKEGPAQILTVVQGQKVEAFRIQIVSSHPQHSPSTKGLVLKVTDPRLLSITGGIVQGMSGSPIIQNGKIIGAVTHVFVNDPTAGYGTFIEWMLKDAGIQTFADTLSGARFFLIERGKPASLSKGSYSRNQFRD
jgi:stage IV sporulation protein B